MRTNAAWRAHFEANRTRPLPEVTAPPLKPHLRSALAGSLARFQLGESGEGRVAHEIDRARLPGVDADFRAALKLFVAEEGRHARILGHMVNALEGRLLEKSWTERLFVIARRVLGLRFKLLVLLAAEVIGIGFYGLLAAALPKSPLSAALEEICADEEAHLEFHSDFFAAQPALFRVIWWPLGTCAALAVLVDHRATLRAFGVPPAAAARRLFDRVRLARSQMGQRAPVFTQLTSPHSSASVR
jgi:hypothetical protein